MFKNKKTTVKREKDSTPLVAHKKRITSQPKPPLEAIRQHCIQCSGGSIKMVKCCNIPDCPLYVFRLGHNPNRKKIGNIRNLKHEDIKPVQSVASKKIRKKIPTEQPNFSKRMDLKGSTQPLQNEANGGK